jgi:hypothetical protein
MEKKSGVIVYISGGLGNQMFQYAFGRYLSLKNNVPLKLDLSLFADNNPKTGFTPRKYALDIFNISAAIARERELPFFSRGHFSGKWGYIIETIRETRMGDIIQRRLLNGPGYEQHFQFDEKALLLGENVYLNGYWQSEKYFKPAADIIRADFTLNKPLSNQSQILSKEIGDSNSVCMHVRRSDYVGHALHDIVDKDYYKRALELLVKEHPVDKIYIFSDDIEWCKNNMNFNVNVMFVDETYAGEKDSEHFALMTACKHFIIPNSSYSWWAAWLGNYAQKQVIAPKRWFADAAINTADIAPEDWTRI